MYPARKRASFLNGVSPEFRNLALLAAPVLVLANAIRRAKSLSSGLGAALAFLLGIAPSVWVVLVHQVSTTLVVGYAGLLFTASVLLKSGLFAQILVRRVYARLKPTACGVIQGFVSATCELGVAAAGFAYLFPNLGRWEVFGFGAGAAALEAAIVVSIGNHFQGTPEGGYVATESERLESGVAWAAAAVPVLDRLVATALHIGCRGLVAHAVLTAQFWPFAAAFLCFAGTDGFVYYALRSRWRFSVPSIAFKLYAPGGLLGLGSLVLWAWV